MGRLVGLELSNFKSYRGVASIGFGSANFTSIIGPNGSGKSNMMDAISFVLGVRSSSLRSTQLKDLIYRGRIEDSDDSESEDDPTTAYVMAIYEKTNGDVLKLKRVITPNGSSEYLINSQQVTAAQYAEVLKEENILIKAKNFLVFQGDVEKIASQSSQTLTTLIETISGSAEFKKEYDRLHEEKEKAHDATALCNTKRRTLKEELQQYKRQCREVDEYDRKTEQLESTVQAKYLSKLYFNDKSVKDAQKELKEQKSAARKLQADIASKEKELREFIRSQSDGNEGYRELEAKIASNRGVVSEKKRQLIPLEAETSQVEKKLADYSKRIGKLGAELERQTETVEETESQLGKIQRAYEGFSKQAAEEAAENNKAVDPRAAEEYAQLREQFLMKGGHIETKLADLLDDKESLQQRADGYQHKKELIEARVKDLESTKSDLNTQYEEVKSHIGEVTGQMAAKKRELNSLRASRDSVQQQQFGTNAELKKVLLRLNELGSLQRESVKERRLRENCAALKRLFPDVYGLLSDVCKPKQRRYEAAVSTVMGRNMDAIVVSNISVAAECIEYLKEQRAGSASFIPLNSVSATPVSQQLRSISSAVRPAIDVIEYDSEYERAVQYACGDAVICDTLEVAKTVRWERSINVRAVTLDGSVIQKSGIMTGGQSKNQGSDRWDKAELNGLLARKEELKNQLAELEHKKPSELLDKNLLGDLDRLEAELPPLKESKEDLKRAIRDADTETRHQGRLQAELAEEVARFEQETVAPLDASVDATQVQLRLVEASVYGEFCTEFGFDGVAEYEERYGGVSQQRSKDGLLYQKELQRLASRLQFEQERQSDYEERVSKLREDRDRFSEQAKEIEHRQSALQQEVDRLESEIEVFQEEYDQLQGQIRETVDESAELKTAIHDLKLQRTKVNKKISVLEDTADKVRLEKLGILRSCKVENVDLPLRSGSLDDVKLDENDSGDEDEMDVDGGAEDDDNTSGIKPDYSRLDKKYKQGTAEDRAKEIDDKIETLKSELSGMSPNTNARERLDEAQARLNTADEEFATCKEHERAQGSEFEAVRKQRYDAFMKAYKHISECIDPVYKELTKSAVSPLGGSTYLTLEDEDEPYLAGVKYHAMPPTKRFRDMDLLSGGEKTVAALALLFAVHSFHPSPFFVLDEVDSALDNANVHRVAKYIGDHAGPDFQFIVISLKNQLYQKSDALVGIYKEQSLNTSKTLTLDLRKYATTA